MTDAEFWEVERGLWLGGPSAFRRWVSADCVMVFPEPVGMLRRLTQVLSLETEKPSEVAGGRQLQVCVRERRVDGHSAFEQFLRVVHSRVDQRVHPLRVQPERLERCR